MLMLGHSHGAFPTDCVICIRWGYTELFPFQNIFTVRPKGCVVGNRYSSPKNDGFIAYKDELSLVWRGASNRSSVATSVERVAPDELVRSHR